MKILNTILNTTLAIILILCIVAFFTPVNNRVKDSFFDGQVQVERAKHGLSTRDSVTFVFNQPGTYQVAFFPRKDGSHSSLPENFTISINESDVPFIEVVKKYSIEDCTITIIKNGTQVESRKFYLPERD